MDILLHGLNEFINLLWTGRFLQLNVVSKRITKDRVAVYYLREVQCTEWKEQIPGQTPVGLRS